MLHRCQWSFVVPLKSVLTRGKHPGWCLLAWVELIVAKTLCETSFGGPTSQTTTREPKRTRTPEVQVGVEQESLWCGERQGQPDGGTRVRIQ